MPFANYFFSVEGAEKKHLIFWSKIVQRKLNELFSLEKEGGTFPLEHSGGKWGKSLVAEKAYLAEILAKSI